MCKFPYYKLGFLAFKDLLKAFFLAVADTKTKA